MILEGTVTKGDDHWLVEVPALGLVSQGRTRQGALDMAVDTIETFVDKPGFKVGILDNGLGAVIGFKSGNTQVFMDLCIQRNFRKEKRE